MTVSDAAGTPTQIGAWLWAPLRPMPHTFDAAGVQERLRVTLAGVVLGPPGLVLGIPLFVLTLLCIPLSVAAFSGYLLSFAMVPLVAVFAGVYRAAASQLLGAPVTVSHLPAAGIGAPIVWLRDPARWREVGYLAFAATGGFIMSTLPALLLVTPFVHLILAMALGSTTWLVLAIRGGPALLAWWFVAIPLAQARAGADRVILDTARVQELEARVEKVTTSRSESLDHSAAELRRIERDLHDGAQARVASVGMSVGLAEQLVASDPAAAAALLAEARQTTVAAFEELRTVIRGIHPPALADRGLGGAVEALAVTVPLPVTVMVPTALAQPGSLPAPVESAAYFAITECLSNVLKHASARHAWVRLRLIDDNLECEVEDDGVGGAVATAGSGLAGLQRRLAAFDGTVTVASPTGGPTKITMLIRVGA